MKFLLLAYRVAPEPLVQSCRAAFLALIVVCAAPSVEAAESSPMRPALHRLVEDPACAQLVGSPACRPDLSRFRRLVSQWGAILAPRSKGGARSLPARSVELAIVAEVTALSSSADYWRLGSVGSSSAQAQNENPDEQLVGYSLHVRRGLGLGLQVSGSVGYLPAAGVTLWGVDVRQGLLEAMGNDRSVLGLDISVGAGARAATGFGELRVSSQVADIRIARTFNLSSQRQLTPWVGPQLLRIRGSSEWVDFTPQSRFVPSCSSPGSSSEAIVGAAAVRCESPATEQANVNRFRDISITRQRVQAGISLRQDVLVVGLELAADWFPTQYEPAAGGPGELDCTTCRPAARQWAADLQLGVLF